MKWKDMLVISSFLFLFFSVFSFLLLIVSLAFFFFVWGTGMVDVYVNVYYHFIKIIFIPLINLSACRGAYVLLLHIDAFRCCLFL